MLKKCVILTVGLLLIFLSGAISAQQDTLSSDASEVQTTAAAGNQTGAEKNTATIAQPQQEPA